MEQKKYSIVKKISALEWYSLLLCIFSIPLFESPKTIFLIISAFLFLTRHYIERDFKDIFFIKDPRLGFLALIGASAISAIFAQRPGLAIHGSLDFLKMYLLFTIVATDFRDNKSVKIISFFVIISAAIGAVWGFMEYTIIKNAQLQLNSVGHFNHTSIYLALTLWIVVCYFSIIHNKLEKSVIALCGMLIVFALMLTTSRATFLALLISFIITFIFDRSARKKIFYLFITAILISIPSFLYLYHTAPNLLAKGFGIKSLYLRFEHWNLAWEGFKSNFLLGVGAKHIKFLDPKAYGVAVTEKLSHAHNLYLNILVQYGIAGFFALLLLFYLIFKWLKQVKEKNLMWSAAFGSFIIVLVNGILNTTLHSEHGLVFSLILAIAPGINVECCQKTSTQREFTTLL